MTEGAHLRATIKERDETIARVKALIDGWMGGTGHTDNNKFVSIANLKAALKDLS